MSANNWADCPHCLAVARAAKDEAVRHAAESYGKVPVSEFDVLRALAEAPIQMESTFREDYEIYGAEDGVVQVSYGGSCDECGAHLEFKFSQKVVLP